jgi:hypothetical protein
MALTKVTYSMIDGAMVNVLDYGAVGDNTTDCTAAIQAAVNTGKPVFFPLGVYRITAPIVTTGVDFVIIGETYDAMFEKNNEENDFSGSVINYFGSDNSYAIDVVNTPALTSQISIRNMTIVAAKTHQTGVVRINGNGFTTEYGGELTMSDVRIQTRDFNGSLNGYVATGLVLDCDNKWFFGASLTNIYLFGFERGILISAGNGGFFNSNTLINIKQYQVWRALELTTIDTVAGTSIQANTFNGFYVQPNAIGGVWCDGVIFLDGNVTQNVFVTPIVWDMPLGTGQEFRSETDFVGTGRWFENIFVGPMSNNIFNGRIGTGLFVGWGQNSLGQFAASQASFYLADPTINTTATVFTFIDQNNASIRYPRYINGNEIEVYISGSVLALKIDTQGVMYPLQEPSAPPYVQGGIYFDTTLNKLRVGGASGWETITSS